ncbi:hypothetical protein [Klenkia sp. PcliD-1-E]|uniref:hypothetical protein n=1 Tax=Klenkia sp. PcliD-1-E TaxID=2954492 RepID=UPI002097BDE4|nr:hypothetical protein [Klenkia sp. PcliD-1-E]MCO7219593.1 hypothetical protein [Klenkia sp. PcliD-1-E]
MSLSPTELAALQDIEAQLVGEGPTGSPGRTWALAAALLVGAAVLLVVGAVVGNPAAVVLGAAWALAAPVAWVVQRRFAGAAALGGGAS